MTRIELEPVDRVRVTILMDNVTDVLIPDQGPVSRFNAPKALADSAPRVDAIKVDSGFAPFTFRAATSWKEGTHSIARIGGFTHAGEEDRSRAAPFVLEGDEPPVLLGRNIGPNAVELLLEVIG